MSNQDPFGTPPQQPPGQEPQQPPTPPQQPPTGPGFGSGPGVPPPPPPKKKTGLIIGAIIAALVVIGGLVVGGVVLLGGDDDKDNDSSSEKATDDPTDEPSDEPSDEPTEEPTEEPTDEPTEEPTDGGSEILGTNYSYALPGPEWVDATAEVTAAGAAVDSAIIWGATLAEARANVLVEAGPASGTLKDERANWETNLTAGGSKLSRLDNVTIDGENAYAVELKGTNQAGAEVFQTVYLTLHQEIVYSIGFTSPPGDDDVEAAFNVVKDSWAWTS